MLTCFLPKSRASMDQYPGPIMAKVAPSPAGIMRIHRSAGCEIAITTSAIATIVPATGVHRPSRRSIPAPTAITCETVDATGAVSPKCAIA